MRPSWIEINLELLKENARNLKACKAPQAQFMAVIKADGYGLRWIRMSRQSFRLV